MHRRRKTSFTQRYVEGSGTSTHNAVVDKSGYDCSNARQTENATFPRTNHDQLSHSSDLAIYLEFDLE